MPYELSSRSLCIRRVYACKHVAARRGTCASARLSNRTWNATSFRVASHAALPLRARYPWLSLLRCALGSTPHIMSSALLDGCPVEDQTVVPVFRWQAYRRFSPGTVATEIARHTRYTDEAQICPQSGLTQTDHLTDHRHQRRSLNTRQPRRRPPPEGAMARASMAALKLARCFCAISRSVVTTACPARR